MAAKKQQEAPSGLQVLLGTLLLPIALFTLLGLVSYDWQDMPFLFLQSPSGQMASNWVGPVGAWLSCFLFMMAGVGAYGVPVWFAVTGLLMIFKRGNFWPKSLWTGLALIAFASVLDLHGAFNVKAYLNITDNGGVMGWLVTQGILIRLLSPIGAGILIWSLFIFAFVMAIGIPTFVRLYHYSLAASGLVGEHIAERRSQTHDRKQLIEQEERRIEKQRRKLEKEMQRRERKELIQQKAEALAARKAEPAPEMPRPKKPGKKPIKTAQAPVEAPLPAPVIDPDRAQFPGYILPPMSLLDELPASHGKGDLGDTSVVAQALVDTLNEFGISTEVTNVKQGPVVTRYELLPAPGIRVERIAGLANNLALALKATSLRVQAPVPGKGVVGIEVPNDVAKMVVLREILESPEWRAGTSRVPMALGKDVGGKDLVGDLAKMPHILIAGATGAGKSVCINSILAGLLMSKTPDELRLILVDPKIVEFSVYNNLPHLVVPVITDPQKVSLSLRWAINEMEKRYKLFAKAKVRNIESFNNRVIAQQGELFGAEPSDAPPLEKPKDDLPSSVPYIVIVIDELADLMLSAGAEIENSIARLAQLSRAVGIHMIIATQRPSVNVITGTIKANFPARIAFQVAQKTDSRTILDQSGADQLIGRGDMLYLPPGSSKLIRSQGAMVTDDEIHRIIEHIKAQAEPAFEMEIKNKLEKPASASMDNGGDDEILTQAVEVIRETHRCSTSSLQRRLRIGYTRAARLVDILEERGIVGPPRGSEPREILIDLDVDMPNNTDDSADPDQEEEDVVERVV
ncbi:MAG: DNA translocase FtsK [Verrucomicrobia bacterium]|nr:DNA translocase FtsK [Verrucomicrobiota bacterium]